MQHATKARMHTGTPIECCRESGSARGGSGWVDLSRGIEPLDPEATAADTSYTDMKLIAPWGCSG